MKHRITYLVKDPDTFTPEQLVVKDGSVTLNQVDAVKEHRINLQLNELPSELKAALAQWRGFHLRWVSSKVYSTTPPFTSRVSPGLHVFYTPREGQQEDGLCDAIHNVFGRELPCSSTEGTSIRLANPFALLSMESEYYAYLPTLSNLVTYMKTKICKPSSKRCKEDAESLLSVSYLDIDHDSDKNSVQLTAFWSSPPKSTAWTETIYKSAQDDTKTEVGVLTHEPNPDPEDIAFGGFLTVLDADPKPKPTRFQTPARHYPNPDTHLIYDTEFLHPTGLHPTLRLSFPTSTILKPDATCKLYAHMTLPSFLFIDRYQFTDPLFLESHNLVSLVNLTGATDLEAPDWVVPEWGSTALFEMKTHGEVWNAETPIWTAAMYYVTIPLHLRYLPAAAQSHRKMPVPWPVVFWACDAEEGNHAMSPFDRKHLGYETLFKKNTRFMHVQPWGSHNGEKRELVSWIDVPVLDLRKTAWVETGTIGVVVVAFLGLCWVLFGNVGAKKETKDVKKKQ